ncbi:hypothetical protein B296_00056706 [Ensete ventricosum]|uniref:Uncharacterized protein n=1 Tax=Ensete ventricosum TaxID=4639 RepID=A0A426XGA1_ENSVE|nr:hypothetical protein B296_00056706 [Ensete ventricosum]
MKEGRGRRMVSGKRESCDERGKREEDGPCALVRPRSSRDGVGARLDGWIPCTPSRGLTAEVVELGLGGGTSVSVMGHPYLATLLPLWLTMPSYPSTTLVVLALLARGGFGLVPSGSSRTDPTEQELGNLNGAGADPTEQELGNLNGAGADPTEQELGNLNDA